MRTIVCFGDSNTHGEDPLTQGRLARDVRWPGILGAELGADYAVIEEALNGRTTIWDDPTSEYRNGRDYLLPCLWSHVPVDLVAIMLGTNDLKVTFGLTAPEIAGGVGLLVDLARRSLAGPEKTPPAVLLIAPPPLGKLTALSELWGFGDAYDASRQLGRLYRLVAEDNGCAFLDAGEVVSASEVDGVHLDAAAHGRLGREVARVVKGLFGA